MAGCAAMPALLRPKAPFAADAIVVGDPARALLLAQDLLQQPKMCNHARGLWGYVGATAAGRDLTIQATGVGAPSAAAVLADLAELGVGRAVRVGTATALGREARLGELLIVTEAVASEGSAAAFGVAAGEALAADSELTGRLGEALGDDARAARIVSLDTVPSPAGRAAGAAAADMQTVALLARARELGIAVAALLAVVETRAHAQLDQERAERLAKLAGQAASRVLSP
jgi:uridine phosphorylase